MHYRNVGQTGLSASVIGIGLERVDTKPLEKVEEVIHCALDHGVNIMDMFMPGQEIRGNIGKALTGRRDKVLLQGAIGSVDLNLQYDISRDLDICKRYFEEMLRCLKTDYIDFGMLFYLDTHEAIDEMIHNGVVEYARQLKREGKIRAIGASLHNPETGLRLVNENMVDMMMFSINPAFDMMTGAAISPEELLDDQFADRAVSVDPRRAELYRLCQNRGVGITVMKSLAAGKLLSADHSPFSQAMTPAQCIHYALNRPAVASVLVGCESRGQVEEAVRYLDLSDEERDYSQVINRFRDDGKSGFAGSCVYCNHCLPCPAEIDVAAVNKLLDIASLDKNNIPAALVSQYQSLKSHGSDCLECGSCEERCPFSVEVIEKMAGAAALFGR
ncbi:aldo/keto reductase [Deltaproteobacteria bacterium Smac51]|nr:aldo/keto reductase [Deltaproteobacteria bacterium Smac51]